MATEQQTVTCRRCHGDGVVPVDFEVDTHQWVTEDCPTCGGTGVVEAMAA